MSKFSIMMENDGAFDAADKEVFEMIDKGRGAGGELPRAAVKVLPADRADAIIALDKRIQQAKAAIPFLMAACGALLGLILGLAI